MSKPASIFIPIMDNGSDSARIGFLQSMFALGLSGVLRGREIDAPAQSYPYPDCNNNIATEDFLLSGFDEMLKFDVDVIFKPQHVAWLLSHDVGIVAGIVPKKKPGLEYSIIPLESNPDPFNGPDNLCEVEVACGGWIRIRREVFETLKKHPDVKQYTCLETGRVQWSFWQTIAGGTSDDFNLCRRYREMGGKVYVDRRCTLQHRGNITFPIKGTY